MMDKETFEGFVSQGERLGYTAEKLQLYVEQCTERYERVLDREAKKIQAETELEAKKLAAETEAKMLAAETKRSEERRVGKECLE